MRFLAGAVAALAVSLTLVGCGGGESQALRPETITINLPTVAPARDVFRTDTTATSTARAGGSVQATKAAAYTVADRNALTCVRKKPS